MVQCRLNDKTALRLQNLLDRTVCGLQILSIQHYSMKVISSYLYMQASKVWDLFREDTSIINGARRHLVWSQNAVSNSNPVIIFTEGGGLMDDTSTVCVRYVCVDNDSERLIFKL